MKIRTKILIEIIIITSILIANFIKILPSDQNIDNKKDINNNIKRNENDITVRTQ